MWAGSLTLVVFVACIAIGYTQNDGRYRPPTTIRPLRQRVGDGRYRGSQDGRYRGSQDGRYSSGQDGRYVHSDVKYIHDDRPDGGYDDDISPYAHSNSNSAYNNNNLQNNNAASGINVNNNSAGYDNNANNNNNINTNNAASGNAVNGNAVIKGLDTSGNSKGNRLNDNINGQYNKDKKPWSIIQLRDKVDKDGYEYLYETENGILAEENGSIQKLTTDDGLRSRGFYEYIGDDGVKYRVDYVADDNGFVPTGDHIPTPPPYVKKLLEFLEANGKKS